MITPLDLGSGDKYSPGPGISLFSFKLNTSSRALPVPILTFAEVGRLSVWYYPTPGVKSILTFCLPPIVTAWPFPFPNVEVSLL